MIGRQIHHSTFNLCSISLKPIGLKMMSPTKALGCASAFFLVICCPSAAFISPKHGFKTVHGPSCRCSSNVLKLYNNSPVEEGSEEGRRSALIRGACTAMTFLTSVNTMASYSSAANAMVKADASAFVATYTDPNHPGGKRTIRLLNQKVGNYQLAEVQGGGGRGEPENYVLPAVILGNRSIVIDFSPKGGPIDFAGVLVDGTDIKFLKDGNRWPRVS